MQKRLPFSIRRLFWDVCPDTLDLNLHAKMIIERVLNNGTLTDWRWLVAAYGSQQLHSIMDTNDKFGRSNLRIPSRHLASLLLSA